MGGFDDAAIDRLEDEAREDEVSMYSTEVSHLRELCEDRARQLSAAETAVRELEGRMLELHDRLKYYGDIVTIDQLGEILKLTTNARKTLE